jgi:Tol biopolymer transport system component
MLSLSFGQTMKVHTKGSTIPASYSLSSIDSITFEMPSSNKVVFISNRSGAQQVWLVNIDGTGLKQLTNSSTTYKTMPRWSTSGSKIAYAEGNNFDGGLKINIIDTEGKLLKTLETAASVSVYGVAWSADDQWIYYTEAITCGERIRKINIDSNTLDSIVVDSTGVQQNPDINPVSNNMLYRQAGCNVNASVFVYNLQTKTKTQLTTSEADTSFESPRWSQDGSKIIYAAHLSTASTYCNVRIMNSDGTAKQKISTCMASFPDYSNGKIVFCRYVNDVVSGNKTNIWIMDNNGANLFQLTTGNYLDQCPDVN